MIRHDSEGNEIVYPHLVIAGHTIDGEDEYDLVLFEAPGKSRFIETRPTQWKAVRAAEEYIKQYGRPMMRYSWQRVEEDTWLPPAPTEADLANPDNETW